MFSPADRLMRRNVVDRGAINDNSKLNSLVSDRTLSLTTTDAVIPELLAPAGDWDCIRAAVENGANAVYFGLDTGFNARARATNFSPADLPEIMAFLHQRGVRGYVTFNTLVFPSELAQAETHLRQIAAADVDAVLIQDLGLVRLIRALCPDLPIHASTQMTLTSAECIAAAEELGVERIVLPRELSIAEIDRIHRNSTMPLEAFVHGALCVAYSGQCLTSESFGGRSANRGQCAQACRLPYELVCDGEDIDLGDQKYLLSPQDLAGFELIPELLAAGVCSFKIEGRLKTAEYVANITRHYRQAIDTALLGQPVRFSKTQVQEMELSFSRGFSPGWLKGCDHKMLVPALSSSKRGIFLGTVKNVRSPRVLISLAAPIAAGDGLVFEGDRANNEEQGGRVFGVFRGGQRLEQPVSTGLVELEFGRDSINLDALRPGQQLWKTDDPQLSKRLRETYTGADPLRRVPLDLTVSASVGEPLTIKGRADSGATCEVVSEAPLEAARKHALTIETLREQLNRFGSSVYELRQLDAHIVGAPMIPLSVLSKLRQTAIQQLDDSARALRPRRIATDSVVDAMRLSLPARRIDAAQPPILRALCRNLTQLRTVLDAGLRSVFVEFQDIREYREAVEIAHAAESEIWLATTRIQKPTEAGLFRAIQKHGADGILVRNMAGLLHFVEQGIPVIADFSLNAANELTTQYLIEQGAQRVTASYDLNREQLLDLVAATPPDWLEVVIHQHMPMFHMEHCVFCSVLSPGTDATNCGRPCDTHLVQLRDRIGMEHPLKADIGCRNTLFNAVPQSAAEVVPELLQHGVTNYRVEFLDHSPSDVTAILDLYRDLLSERVSGRDVWTKLKASNRVGVTRGTLEERRNPLAIL